MRAQIPLRTAPRKQRLTAVRPRGTDAMYQAALEAALPIVTGWRDSLTGSSALVTFVCECVLQPHLCACTPASWIVWLAWSYSSYLHIHAVQQLTLVKNPANFSRTHTLLRELALLLFPSFHFDEHRVTARDGRLQHKSPSPRVTEKVTSIIVNGALGSGTPYIALIVLSYVLEILLC
mgnify:CR=1 FL=1